MAIGGAYATTLRPDRPPEAGEAAESGVFGTFVRCRMAYLDLRRVLEGKLVPEAVQTVVQRQRDQRHDQPGPDRGPTVVLYGSHDGVMGICSHGGNLPPGVRSGNRRATPLVQTLDLLTLWKRFGR